MFTTREKTADADMDIQTRKDVLRNAKPSNLVASGATCNQIFVRLHSVSAIRDTSIRDMVKIIKKIRDNRCKKLVC